jgi:hypothetical protein
VRAGPVFVVVSLVVLALVPLARPAFAANPRAEAGALDALSKAEGDFLGMNYASGAARLDKALRACAPANCSAATQAALLRDIGTMEFRAGDKGFATKAFTEALKLQPNIDLNPSYDSPDLRAAWVEVKGGGAPAGPVAPTAPGVPAGGGAPPPPSFQQPTGDFIHVPAAEQRVDTPLPVYVEAGPNGVAHVIVRFNSSEDSDEAEWNHMDLSRVGAGWGGVIPCAAVLGGTLRYYIQGYNKDMDPIATNGDAKTPYQVPIRDELAGPAPHLPNRAPPRACHQAAKPKPTEAAAASSEDKETAKEDCPPGMPGCGKSDKGDEDEDTSKSDEDEGDEKGTSKKKKKKEFSRWWVGVSAHLDFMQIPSGPDLCRLHPNNAPGAPIATPANDKHFYCTDTLTGNDFPTRIRPDQNNELTPLNAGQSNGGVVPGNFRIFASLDYAATSNILIGGRIGFVLGTYQGTAKSTANTYGPAAIHDGYAWGQPFYAELRLTGVIGKDPLRKGGWAPLLFVGGGASDFDAHTSGSATLCARNANPVPPACMMPMADKPDTRVNVDMWITNGPLFIDFGGGVRYGFSPHLGFTGALRVNVSLGSNGAIPTVGPELGLQYGF